MFSEALIHSVQQLEDAKHRGLLLDFALIGGFAVAAWGAPRATHDVDFAVAIGSADPHATAASLGGPQDRLDAEGILKAQQPQDAELNQLRALALSAGLLEEWESLLRRSFPR